jgi:lysophospholipase L1-like esterase
MVKNIADFERQYATYDVNAKLKEAFVFGADLVVVAIGENVPNLASDEAKLQFKNGLTKLLRGLKADRHPTIVVRSCFWANPAKDQILQQVCQEARGIFVDIGKLGQDESNYARSERQFKHEGVAAHPGDKGMQAIADAILAAIKVR